MAYTAYFHPSLIGVTGSEADIARVAAQFGAGYVKQPVRPDGSYAVDHSQYLPPLRQGRQAAGDGADRRTEATRRRRLSPGTCDDTPILACRCGAGRAGLYRRLTVVDAARLQREHAVIIDRGAALVARHGLTDLALFTEARYTRATVR